MVTGLWWLLGGSFYFFMNTQAIPTASNVNVTIKLGTPYEFKSPGFPTCCTKTSLSYNFRCVDPNDEESQACYFRFNFIDVDLPTGSFVKIVDSEGRFLDSISQVWSANNAAWHRPMTATSTNKVTVTVHLPEYLKTASSTPYVGFRAVIHTAKVPGNPNWIDRPSALDCPEIFSPESGVVRVHPSRSGGHQQDCIWQIKGVAGCQVYVNVVELQGPAVQIHHGLSSMGPVVPERVKAWHRVTSSGGLFIRMQRYGQEGTFIFTYGCFLPAGSYDFTSRHGGFAANLPETCESSTAAPRRGIVCVHEEWCISWRARCNGYPDCPGMTDERNCEVEGLTPRSPPELTSDLSTNDPSNIFLRRGEQACPSHMPFACRSGRGCYGSDQMCDGYGDCPDGTDERSMRCHQPKPMRGNPGSSGVIYAVCILPLAALILIFLAYYRIKLRRGLMPRLGPRRATEPPLPDGPGPPPQYAVALAHPKPEQYPLACLPKYDSLYWPDGSPRPYDAPPDFFRYPPTDSASVRDGATVAPPTQQVPPGGASELRPTGSERLKATCSYDNRGYVSGPEGQKVVNTREMSENTDRRQDEGGLSPSAPVPLPSDVQPAASHC